MIITRSRAATALVAASLLLAACASTDTTAPDSSVPGSSAPDSSGTTAPSSATPSATGTTGTLDTPTQIVSMSPTATEMLFAIDAGDLVVAADSFSTYPPEAPDIADLSAFTPNVEAIAEYEPDLVVLSNNPDDIQGQLEALSIDTVLLPSAATIDDTYDQIQQLGQLTGRADAATQLVDTMQRDIQQAVDSVDVPEGTTYYHELDDTYYSAASTTFIGDVYGQFGMTSIADEASADDNGGFPQLSAEYVVDADPDLVFLADAAGSDVSAESVAGRPGWATMSAVKDGRVVELPADIPSRWGPRIVDFADVVAKAVSGLDS